MSDGEDDLPECSWQECVAEKVISEEILPCLPCEGGGVKCSCKGDLPVRRLEIRFSASTAEARFVEGRPHRLWAVLCREDSTRLGLHVFMSDVPVKLLVRR